MSICPECGYRVKVASANRTRKGGDGVWRHKSHKKVSGTYYGLEPGFEQQPKPKPRPRSW